MIKTSRKRHARFRSPYNLRSTRRRTMDDIGAKQVGKLSYHSNEMKIESIDEQVAYLRRLPLSEEDLNQMMMEIKNNMTRK